MLAAAAASVASDPLVGGISVALAADDGYVWSSASGFANLEHRVPMRPWTRSRIGSVTKPIVATALMSLAERGALDLDAPIERYVPRWPASQPSITLRMLASHTSGIRHYEERDRAVGAVQHWDHTVLKAYRSSAQVLEIFSTDPLVHRPGQAESYSSYAWALIGAAIEQATGKPLLDWLESSALPSLGLTETVPDRLYAIVPHRAASYEADGPELRIAPYADRSYVWAGGGLLSTARDLAAFGVRSMRPGLLSKQSISRMLAASRLNDGTEGRYGVGWQVDYAGHADELLKDATVEPALAQRLRAAAARLPKPTVGHDGSAPGAIAQLLVAPQEGVAAAYIVNSNTDSDVWYFRLQAAHLEAFNALAATARACASSKVRQEGPR